MDPADLQHLSPFLREKSLLAGQPLYEPGDDVGLIYFPSSCSIAVITVTAAGHNVETASIGFEGAVGLVPALSHQGSPSRMTVQIGGGAIVLPAANLRERAESSATLMKTMLVFFHAAMSQTQQSVACALVHPLRARLARCLLVCEDRVGRAKIMLTQDDMGLMAGALRSSISLAASEFKDAGLIHYSRGHLEILDRKGLEDVACGCYRARRFEAGHQAPDGDARRLLHA